MRKYRHLVRFLLFLVPLCLLPLVTRWLIDEERAFGRETGQAYLRVVAAEWAEKAACGEVLPSEPVGPAPSVIVALVDGSGCLLGSSSCFPADGRCYGEAPVRGLTGRFVRATWPGAVGRGQAHVRKLDAIERAVTAVFYILLLAGFAALLLEVRRARVAARHQIDYVADISHRLKTPLTSISLCAELAKAGRLDDSQKAESAETVATEASKLSAILDEVLAHVKEMRRG